MNRMAPPITQSAVRLSPASLLALRTLVLGDAPPGEPSPIAPPQTHREITDFFEHLNFPEQAFVTQVSRENRVAFALKTVNGSDFLVAAIKATLHPGRFPSREQLSKAVAFLNNKLRFDHLKVSIVADDVVLLRHDGVVVEATGANDPLSDDHFQALNQRAETRMQAGEYDAAITVARTLLEDALLELEQRLLGSRENFSGDLVKLYKHVTRVMRLDDQRDDLNEKYKAIVRGLTSVVGALAPLSNASSDRHSPERLPAEHHARLCVNSAKTIAAFLRDSYLAQKALGTLKDHAVGEVQK